MGFEYINPEDLPPEIKVQLAAQQADLDRRHMQAIDRAHRVESFVYGQDQDGLYALSILLGQLIGNKVGTVYWQGQVDALLQERHNVCAIHGVNHEEEALASLSPEGSTPTGDTELSVPQPMLDKIEAGLEELDRLMVEYRVSFNETVEKFYCDDCGYMYPTIEDRMLKAPDDCPGCHLKASQG